MKKVNGELYKKELTIKVLSVADAVAMNAVPEYWVSLKLAGLHALTLLTLAKLFVSKLDLNQLIHH